MRNGALCGNYIVPPSGILFHLVKRQLARHGIVSPVGTPFHSAEFWLKIYIFVFYLNTLYAPIELQNSNSLYKNVKTQSGFYRNSKVETSGDFLYTCSGVREINSVE